MNMFGKRAQRLLVAALVALVASLTATVPAEAQVPPPVGRADEAQLAQKLEADGAADAARALHADTGKVRFVGATPDHPIRRKPGVTPGDPPERAARAFLADYGPLFGVADQARDLRLMGTTAGQRGQASTRFRQTHRGVPVLAGELIVVTDEDNHVLTAAGEVLPDLDVDVTPGIDSASASGEARQLVAKERGVDADALDTTAPELWIYDHRLLGGPGIDAALLVWRMDVTAKGSVHVDELVLIDAARGGVVLHFDQLAHAKARHVCNRNNVRDPSTTSRTPCAAPYARDEGQPATGIADVDSAYDYSGVTYDFYATRFGRDSLDDEGMHLFSTVRYCENDTNAPCPYPNAFWSPSLKQMFYGQGETDGDTVGHELTHGVTNSTSNLFYWMQSGAINESLSDVFGELIDLTDGLGNDDPSVRWKLFEDSASGVLRDMKNPPAFNDPDRMQSSLYWSSVSDNGGVHTNSGVNNKAAYLMTDGATFNGKTVTGIGVDKVAQLYYYVETQLLTSGSDYADLHSALQQACGNLTGTHGISSADCAEVKDAVDATEMHLQPTTVAAVPEAPVCSTGQTPTYRFKDDMEALQTSSDWSIAHTVGTTDWGIANFYATSGTQSMHGPDRSVSTDFTVARTGAFVPENGKTTYLWFRHAYDFEPNWDGGVVEYTTDAGSTWTDAGPLFTHNPYAFGNINESAGTALSGRPAFTNTIGGYYSSRIDLSSLAGQSVRFRFRIATDSSVGRMGWFIDDVAVYTCGTDAPAGGRYTPLTPARILDTRNGTGGISGAVGPGATVDVQITGQGGVPSSGVGAVAMNVTVTQPSATGFLTLYPTGTTRPLAANLNFVPNQTVPNLVVAKVGTGGKVSVYNSSGSSHVIFDVAGWYGEAPAGNDGRFQSLVPARILDTRNGTGGGVRLGPGASLDMQVSGQGGVPATGAGAAVLNVAVTGTTATSFLTVYPTGQPRPLAANLNFVAGNTVSNRVIAKLGTGGKLTIYNNAGSTDVIVDVNGWYTDASVAGTSGTYNPLVPARILDTRNGTGGISGLRPAGSTVDVQVTGQGGVPATGVSAVILNATVTQPGALGYLTIFPAGTARPLASDLNYASGETRPNLVVVKVGADGKVSLFTSASTHVIFDVAGWYG